MTSIEDTGNKKIRSGVLLPDRTNHPQFQRELAMKRNVSGKLSNSTRQMAIAIVASAVVASTAVHANPSNNIVLVPPTDLPEFSRQRGDAILVHEAIDDVRSYTGIPILKVSLSYGVNIADLDLATQDGPMALEKRVKDAAKAACEELDQKYPPLTSSNEGCAKAAADKAMVKARELVAKARQKIPRGE
jgi:UrcA family protein